MRMWLLIGMRMYLNSRWDYLGAGAKPCVKAQLVMRHYKVALCKHLHLRFQFVAKSYDEVHSADTFGNTFWKISTDRRFIVGNMEKYIYFHKNSTFPCYNQRGYNRGLTTVTVFRLGALDCKKPARSLKKKKKKRVRVPVQASHTAPLRP